MPLRSIYSKAVRLNGYTDGIVVPTGAFRESGVDLFPPSYSGSYKANSDEPRLGRHHIPNENNPLNNTIGPFTLEAFVIPDYGGVVIHKEGCYSLKVGDVGKAGKILFDVHTLDSSGIQQSQRVMSTTSYPAPLVGEGMGGENYMDGRRYPSDKELNKRELLYVCAQFTGKEMKIYANGDLVGSIDFGGEERIVRSFSSDVFLGGQGGEYQGVLESIRISRGVIEPKLEQFTLTGDTTGLWNFNDERDIPELYFANGLNYITDAGGESSTGDMKDNMLETPMVCIGFDFHTITSASTMSPPFHPLSLPANHSYGIMRIRDGGVAYATHRDSAYERLAAHLLGISTKDLPHQSWWSSGVLDLRSEVSGGAAYAANVGVSPLNAIINHSGTHPVTGVARTPSNQFIHTPSASVPHTIASGNTSLAPMMNPIERIRIIAIDFVGKFGSGGYDPQQPVGATTLFSGVPYYNRAPCLVFQSVHLANNAEALEPVGQGLLFKHPDDTPVWFTLGNADLIIDDGSPKKRHNDDPDAAQWGITVRPKGQRTRARFTQSQMFKDATKYNNDGFFISPKSRMRSNMRKMSPPSIIVGIGNPVPFPNSLMGHWDANNSESLVAATPGERIRNGSFVQWWKNIAPLTAVIDPNNHKRNYALFSWGDGWQWKQTCANANGRSGVEAVVNPAYYTPTGPINTPGGNVTLQAGIIIPTYPANQLHFDGSSWVNGNGIVPKKVPQLTNELEPVPFFTNAAGNAALTTIPGSGVACNTGSYSMYFMITPTYHAAGTSTTLFNTFNNTTKIRLNVPSQPAIEIAGQSSAGLGNINQPDEGQPSLVSIRIDEPNAKLLWGYARDGEYRTAVGNWASTAALIFDDVSPQMAGFELLGQMLQTNSTTTSLTELAKPGFIVHEVMIYAGKLDDGSDMLIRQYFENKYGVGA